MQNRQNYSLKKAKSLGCIEKPSSASSGSSSILVQSSTPSTSPDNYPRKRQLLPADSRARNNFQENQPSSIKLRIDYTKKPQLITEKSNKTTKSENFKIPSSPAIKSPSTKKNKHKAKTDLPKSKSNNIAIVANDVEMTTLCEVDKKTPTIVAEVKPNQTTKNNSNQEEFYKYLGIDTNPSQEKSPTNSTPAEAALHEGHRRSLRVRYQQNATKLAEMNDKERESMDGISEKSNTKSKASPKSSKTTSPVKRKHKRNQKQKPNTNEKRKEKTNEKPGEKSSEKPSESKTKNVSTPKTSEKNKTTKENSTPQQIVKISYIKPDSLLPKDSPNEKQYKAICLLPSTERPTSCNSDCQIVGETLLPTIETDNPQSNLESFIVDRRFYDSGLANGLERSNNAPPYTSKVLVEANNPILRRKRNIPIKTEHEIVLVTTEGMEVEARCPSPLIRENVPDDQNALDLSLHKDQIQPMEIDPYENSEQMPTFTTCLDDANSEQNSSEVEILCTTSTALVSDYEIRDILGIPYPVPRRINRFISKPNEMYRRYKRCLRQSIALKSRLKYQQKQRRRKIEKRLQILNSSKEKQNDKRSDVLMETANSSNNVVNNTNDLVQMSTNVAASASSTNQNSLLLPYDENTFSPTSLTHSNASTDSAIVVSSNMEAPSLTTVLSKTITSCNVFEPSVAMQGVISSPLVQIQSSIDKSTDIRYIKNPFNMDTNEPIKAAMILPQTASVSAASDTLIVVQKTRISFWQMSPRYLNMLGNSRSLELIAETKRYSDGK